MRILAIDCATEACSAALFDGGALVDGRFELLHRGHAERLVPMIAELPDKGRADRILVSLGPGSFTGVRIGLAAARALGLAWGAEVFGYPTMALVAAMAQEEHPDRPLTVCTTGGHGEWFVQEFGAVGLPLAEVISQTPEAAKRSLRNSIVAGSRAGDLLANSGAEAIALDILPDARCAHLLPPALLTPALSPIYGRPPDARLPGAV
ncbi:MAG: tRNA (adenosine(37)-N6)-threonylcarbamoyltransferase complex dimerization subunit type 1 TsaB [Erythrobacter sp.]|nr:MAG: tRNA (adenosine(37)-N6)-threonylcarbamoyltransferase complex dimerization subunit type 1 TsaB [Erythrobacter sp.]